MTTAISLETQFKQEIANLERSILEIQGQIAHLAERRLAQAPAPVLVAAEGDPIEEARQQVAAEKAAKGLAEEQAALYAVLFRYEEALNLSRANLAQVQQEGALEASRSTVEAANKELLALASQIQELRSQQKKLLIQAAKVSQDAKLRSALKNLGISGSYLDLWLLGSDTDTFDSPNLGKLTSLNFVSGDRLKDLPPTQKWTVVSQSLINAQDFKKHG